MAKRTIYVYDVYWAPTGAKIATVEASTAKLAKSKAPAPYSKYKGEMYVEKRGAREGANLYDRTNPAAKMKRKAPKGWIKARGVKITRKGGRVEVLIRK